MPKTSLQLLELVDDFVIKSEELDTYVYDAVCDLANAINCREIKDQVAFLVERWGKKKLSPA